MYSMQQGRDITTAMLFIVMMYYVSTSVSTAAIDSKYYLLPTNIRAKAYYLNLTVNMDTETFTGNLILKFDVINATKSMELHADKNLKINQITLKYNGNDSSLYVKNYNRSKNILSIQFSKKIEKKEFWLEMENYSGEMNNQSQTGFYCQKYKDGKVIPKFAAAILKPTYARTVFPCLDEPNQKATFKIFITRAKNYHVVSNGLKVGYTPVGNDMIQDEFEETPKMSTYLVSFIISQLEWSKKIINIHHVLGRSQAIANNQADYSIGAAAGILNKFQNYVGKEYPLKLLNHVAIPMDAMSDVAFATWGLIIYKESNFLFTVQTSFAKEGINVLIADQIAQLWFGNLVTIKWWRYNWLQEGLAEYLSHKLVFEMNPDWLVMAVFKFSNLAAQLQDSFHHNETLDCIDCEPKEMHENAHILLRPKGAAILHMLEVIISSGVFQKGIRTFLQKNAYDSIKPTNFYDTMDEAVILNKKKIPGKISKIMSTWDSQAGYPVLQVTRNYGFDTNIVKLQQKPFKVTERQGQKESNQLWYIPINYATKKKPDFHHLQPTAWLNTTRANIVVKDLNQYGWLLVNKQGAYYYRVNYDQNNWNLIIKALIENYHSIEMHHRMQLVDDANALAEAGLIDYDILIGLLLYLPHETYFGPLSVFMKISLTLRSRLLDTDAEKYIDIYFGDPIESIYERLQTDVRTSTEHHHSMKLHLLFTWLCRLNHTRCTKEAQTYNNKLIKGQKIPPELEEHVFCGAIQMNNKDYWNKMFTEVKSSKNFSKNKFQALACTQDKNLLKKYLDYAKSLNRDRLALAMLTLSRQGPIAKHEIITFIGNSIRNVYRLVGVQTLAACLNNIAIEIHSKETLQEFRMIAKKDGYYKYLFDPALELAENNIEWREKHLDRVAGYFEEPGFRSGSIYLIPLNVFVFMIYNTLIINILS